MEMYACGRAEKKRTRKMEFSVRLYIGNLGICNALYNEIRGFIKAATIKDSRKGRRGHMRRDKK